MQENNNQAEPTKAVSNGRNRRRCSNKVSNNTVQAPVCGLIEDASVFTEKLSGQHNKGYVNNTEKPETKETESSTETVAISNEQKAEKTENAPKCKCSKKEKAPCTSEKTAKDESPKQDKHAGPSFEESKNTQKRTLEVELKKVPHKSEKIVEKDAVSYSKVSASMNKNAPKKGLLSKIRAFFSKLVGKKSKKHSKNFKNNRGGYKKNYNSKRKNNFNKSGNFDKAKEGSYRPNNRAKNYNRRPNSYNKPKNTNSTPSTKE